MSVVHQLQQFDEKIARKSRRAYGVLPARRTGRSAFAARTIPDYEPGYFTIFAIATIIRLPTVPMVAIVKGYAGYCKTAPPKRNHATAPTEKRQPAQESLRILPLSMRSVLGAVLPVARMCRPAGWAGGIIYSLQAGYRAECVTIPSFRRRER
jgi:hypothetical protein